MVIPAAPESSIDLRAVTVRPTRGGRGHRLRDRLVEEHHCLRFHGIVGKGLRHVAPHGGTWLASAVRRHPGRARLSGPSRGDVSRRPAVHGRRGIEEMYRSGKSVTGWFHARSERGVRQEPCAAFTPVTLARRFSSRCHGDPDAGGGEGDLPAMRGNLRTAPRRKGDRGPVRETGRRGQAVRRPDHDRAVAPHPAGEAGAQLPAPVHAAREEVDPAHRRLTPDRPRKQAPASGSRPKRGAFPVRTLGILIRMPLTGRDLG